MTTPLRHGSKWTEADERLLMCKFREGEGLHSLCAWLGRTPYAVITRLQQLGALCLINLPPNKPYYAVVHADAWIGMDAVNLLEDQFR